ncbi:hydantoinase/oxoprolinase family protein, partial [Limosilactobacillus reuteri]
ITGFKQALADKGVDNADLYLTQNDGTLMTAEFAQRFPILTIGSGPTNSIRGAAYLAGKDDAIVVDIGGTTTDLGVLKNGFPRESAIAVEVGGVATNFRMPDILSIGLGGGSIVRVQPDGSVTVGPDSVGYEITEKALCFGGDTLTATDIAVRMGLADVGDKTKVSGVSQEVAEAGLAEIKHMIEVAIDKMKTSADDIEVILVGGGAIIAPDHLAGVAKVIAPEKGGVANAIGASISQISGTVDRIYPYTKIDREEALKQAEVEAGEHAKTAGALPDTLSVVEREEIPLAYDPNQSTRVKIKVVGELA